MSPEEIEAQERMNRNPIVLFLNALPLGTIITIAGIFAGLVGLITGELSYLEFIASLPASGVAGGAIGVARNGAGKGVRNTALPPRR